MSNSTNQVTVDGAGTADGSAAGRTGLLSTAVVNAVSDAMGVPPAELDDRLCRHVDLEGVNRLHRHFRELDGAFWSLEFSLDGHDVVVRADGTVSVQ